MLDMREQIRVSNHDQYDGMSLREISKKTGYHFNTVKKYVDMENWNDGYKPRKQRGSLLEPLYSLIDEWLLEDMKRGRKYRRTATKMFKDIQNSEEHSKLLLVGKQSVLNYVNKRKWNAPQSLYQFQS